jgi:uncharacterized protein (DUF169 family)
MMDSVLWRFLDALGLDEEPLGIVYTRDRPASGLCPTFQTPVTRSAEEQGTVDWAQVGENFSCAVSHVWHARKKATAAYFDAAHVGCYGAAFYFGFTTPHLARSAHFMAAGERYVESVAQADRLQRALDPPAAPARFLVIKPISQFASNVDPAIVLFFARPEAICGLKSLSLFVTNDMHVVQTPSFGPGCSSFVTWPMKYLRQGQLKAVIGGLDPSCRQYMKTDEISFAVPFELFQRMLNCWEESFLKTEYWAAAMNKIRESHQVWGEQTLSKPSRQDQAGGGGAPSIA